MSSKITPPPIKEQMFSHPGILSRVWTRFFQTMHDKLEEATDGNASEAALMAAMETPAKDQSAKLEEMEKLIALIPQAQDFMSYIIDLDRHLSMIADGRDFSSRIDEIERWIHSLSVGKDYAQEIQDLQLLYAFGDIGRDETDGMICAPLSPTTLTIASGEITVSAIKNYLWHLIDTEGAAAADDLTKINGGHPGAILTLQSVNAARVPTIKNGASLPMGADFTLDSPLDKMTFICTAADVWEQWGNRANNA
jgi:hypothetical protein